MSLVQRNANASKPKEKLSFALNAVHGILSHLACGALTLVLPNGERAEFDSRAPGPRAELAIHRWRVVWRSVLRGDLGFAESFIDGDCTSPDIAKVVELFARNKVMLDRMAGWVPVHMLNRLIHRRRANTKRGSRRNIVAHYDLGNDFFEHWLDKGMTYSSALYLRADQTLEAAQVAKLDKIVGDLAPAPGMNVLEIGCGWGSLAERIVAAGCTLTGLTLSPSQQAYAQRRLSGFGDAATVRLQDYRDVRGTFDRIVSIEMLEAVGRAFWPVYFQTIRERLARDGRAVLQVITLDDSRYDGYRDQVDFIQRYVFPGGMLPSPTIMREQIAAAGLKLKSVFNFGDSYGRTLAEWSRRFQVTLPQIEASGFDQRFQRLWAYYLAYCEGGFRAGLLDVGLYTLTHADAAG